MTFEITGAFDLDKITNSGQCFRAVRFGTDMYRFITGSNVLYIKQATPFNNACHAINNELFPVQSTPLTSAYEVSCTKEEWQDIWMPYFDLERDYDRIRNMIPASDSFSRKCADFSSGIRILKQEYFEMLISFIISQRKSIPAIRTSIELLCRKFGNPITTEHEIIYSFPTPYQLSTASIKELNDCKLGYRSPYIKDAALKVSNGTIDLNKLALLDDDELFYNLKTFYGVGDKVSNCVALFAYSRTALAPVDTWIKKVIDKEYAGNNPFPAYGDVAGIIQQYIFYYAQMNKSEF